MAKIRADNRPLLDREATAALVEFFTLLNSWDVDLSSAEPENDPAMMNHPTSKRSSEWTR
jgi:hypothetical protein